MTLGTASHMTPSKRKWIASVGRASHRASEAKVLGAVFVGVPEPLVAYVQVTGAATERIDWVRVVAMPSHKPCGRSTLEQNFVRFYHRFLLAITRGDRKAVSRAFRYPFKDFGPPEPEDRVKLGLRTPAELLAKYDRLFTPAAIKELRRPFCFVKPRFQTAWFHGLHLEARYAKGTWRFVSVRVDPS